MTHLHYRPRDMRSKYLGSLAFYRARVNRATIIDAICAEVDAQFGMAAKINSFKLRVERLMLFGPEHAAIRARFGIRASMLRGCNLGAAIIIVKMWQDQERSRARSSEQSMSLDILNELALILRFIKSRALDVQFETYRSEVADE